MEGERYKFEHGLGIIMRIFVLFLMLVSAVGVSGQAVSRTELRNTNNMIDARTVRNTNGIQRGLTTNQGRIQFQTANTNTYQFGGNGTTVSFFDNVSGITFWSYDHSTDQLTETLGKHEVVGTIKAQAYQAGSGAVGATGTSGGWDIEDGIVLAVGTAVNRYTNVAQMLASSVTNTAAETLGYYAPGDGGGGTYVHSTVQIVTNYGSRFASVSGGRWNLIHDGSVSVLQFGVKGDGVQHEDIRLQNILDLACAETNWISHIKVPPERTYLVTNTLLLGRTNAAGAWQFVHGITLDGMREKAGGSGDATFRTTSSNAPIFAIQYGRQITIKGIAFYGNNVISPTYGDAYLHRSNFIASAAIRTNRYSPYAAIVVDPYNSSVASGDRYPGQAGRYETSGLGGTLDVAFLGLYIRNWYVGTMMGPSGALQQGESTLWDQCYIVENAYAVAIGQLQSRAGAFRNSTIGQCFVAFDGNSFGNGIGNLPNITGGNYTQIGNMFYITSSAGDVWTVAYPYGEQIMSLGNVVQQGNSLFIGANFAFESGDHAPFYHGYASGLVRFIGGRLTFQGAPPIFYSTDQSPADTSWKFEGVGIVSYSDGATIPFRFPYFNEPRRVIYDESEVGGAGIISPVRTLSLSSPLNGKFMHLGGQLIISNTVRVLSGEPIMSPGITPVAPTFDAVTGSGTFQNEQGLLKIGDLLYSQNNSTWLSNTPANYQVNAYLGVVTNIVNGTNYYYNHAPLEFSGSSLPALYFYRLHEWHDYTTAHFTSGSATITNVSNPQAWTIGDSILAATGVTPGTWITAMTTNGLGTNFVLSRTVASSGVTEIYDARVSDLISERVTATSYFLGNTNLTNQISAQIAAEAPGSGGSATIPFVRIGVTTTNYGILTSTNLMVDQGVAYIFRFTNGNGTVSSPCNGCELDFYVTNGLGVGLSVSNVGGISNIEWEDQVPPGDAAASDIGVYHIYVKWTLTNGLGRFMVPRGTANIVGKSVTVNGTGNGSITFNDSSNSKSWAITTTNVTQNISNIYINPWTSGPGWCWQVSTTNLNATTGFYEIRWTNGPCGSTAIASAITNNYTATFTNRGIYMAEPANSTTNLDFGSRDSLTNFIAIGVTSVAFTDSNIGPSRVISADIINRTNIAVTVSWPGTWIWRTVTPTTLAASDTTAILIRSVDGKTNAWQLSGSSPPFTSITNPIVSGLFWTNTTSQRVRLKVNWLLDNDAVSGFPSLCMTNVSTGEFYNPTNSFVLATDSSGRTQFDMSPGDYFIVTNKSSGSAAATVTASFVVKE